MIFNPVGEAQVITDPRCLDGNRKTPLGKSGPAIKLQLDGRGRVTTIPSVHP